MKRTSRKPSDLSESLHRQLNAYALAASAAGVGVLALTQPSEAKIVYTRAHIKIPENTSVPLDLNHDGVRDLSFVWRSYSCCGTLGIWVYPPVPNGVIGYQGTGVRVYDASALRGGVRVGSKDKFMTADRVDMWVGYLTDGNGTDSHGQWRDVNRRYIGVKFSAKKKTHYGWVRLNVKENHIGFGLDGVITGYAYESIPNKAIITGKTHGPDVITLQPGTLGRLARGADAIPAWR
jgi:hypothetical protein